MGTVTKVIGRAKGFYDVARYLKKDRATGADRDTGFRMGYNVSPDLVEAAREMEEAAAGRLMREPCLHMVVSPGARLGPSELDVMVGDLLQKMGWQDYQVLAVEHLDTDHQHVHLMISRAHPLLSGESISGYYLYNDLRRWAHAFDLRRERAETHSRPGGPEEVDQAQVGHARDLEVSQDLAGAGAGQPHVPEPPALMDLASMAETAGLGREVWTITELERLAHEKEMTVALLRADARQHRTTGMALLSYDERSVLRQTAQEIGVILARQQMLARPDPARHTGGLETASPSDCAEAVEQSYRDLLATARLYSTDPEAAIRHMKEVAALQGHEAVAWAVRHEPQAFAARTTPPLTPADTAVADAVAEAFGRYEGHRRRYVAEAVGRLNLHGEKTPTQPDAAHRTVGEVDVLERAERLYVREVASRLLEERLEAVQSELRGALAHARRLRDAVRARAFHHLHSALRDTYRDPATAFSRLEAYHGRFQLDIALRRPELLGAMRPAGLRARVRGETARRRAAGLIRRYDRYVEGPEVKEPLATARRRVERLQEQAQVLRALQQRIGTSETAGQAFEALGQRLTSDVRQRLHIRLTHLPASSVRRRTEQLLQATIQQYPVRVRPGPLRGLASPRATERAMRQAARDVGRKIALKRPVRLAMQGAGWATRVWTGKLAVTLHAARTFFER